MMWFTYKVGVPQVAASGRASKSRASASGVCLAARNLLPRQNLAKFIRGPGNKLPGAFVASTAMMLRVQLRMDCKVSVSA